MPLELRFAAAALFATACVGSSAVARATERLPPGIRRDLALSYEPPCSLCHVHGNTGPGTVRTPFGLTMRSRGLRPEGDAALAAALASMEADRVDSDGDGVTDIDELKAGRNPNTPADVPIADPNEPASGCGGSPPGGDGNERRGAVAPIFGLGAAWWARRRRHRARRANAD